RVVTEEFEGNDAPVVQERASEEEFEGNSPAAGGPLGEVDAPVDLEGETQNYTKNQRDLTRAVNKTTTATETKPGRVLRQSVSVLVDQGATNVPLATIEQAVAAAAGVDEDRGDTVSVALAAFDTTAQEQERQARDDAAAAARRDDLLDGLKTIATLVV